MSIAQPDVLCLELAACRTMFVENRTIADRMASGLTLEQFNWKPSAEQWSAAQCLVHLNISADLYAEPMEAAIRRGRSDGQMGSGPFHYGPLARWMLRSVTPGNRSRYKSPSQFAPPDATYGVREVLRAFGAAGRRWEQMLQDANGLDLERIKVRSPAVRLIRLSLGALFEIQATHERRHLLQAEQVMVDSFQW